MKKIYNQPTVTTVNLMGVADLLVSSPGAPNISISPDPGSGVDGD